MTSPDCGEVRVGYLSLLAMPSEGTWLCCVHFCQKEARLRTEYSGTCLNPRD